MIGLIFISELKYCPYLTKYTDILNENNIEFEVLYWNREEQDKDYPENYKAFNLSSKKKRVPLMKITDFIKYRQWLKHIIKEKQYSSLIFLSTLSGMLLNDLAVKKYKNRYLLDIRDFSYEHLKLFFKIEKKIIDNSFQTFISSKGFLNFLPFSNKYKIVHNFQNVELNYKKNFNKKSYGEQLNVVFIGGVRYFNHQKKIIDKLKNDRRFNMVYHGSGIELDLFKKYSEENKIHNILFTGAYNNKDKHKLLAYADILNNSYRTEKIMETKYAISNKFYDGLIYGIPQLVETDSYKSKLINDFSIGVDINENSVKFADELYDYYMGIDVKLFNKNKEQLLKQIIDEDKEFAESINSFIKQMDR